MAWCELRAAAAASWFGIDQGSIHYPGKEKCKMSEIEELNEVEDAEGN